MLDEWEFSSNFLACYPINHHSFYPKAEFLVGHLSKENFHFDSTILASALIPAPPSKRQESISAHDIQNRSGIFNASSFSSRPPAQPSLSEPTLRPIYHQEGIPHSQASSSCCILSDSVQSQLIYSSESDIIKSDSPWTAKHDAHMLPATQLFSKGIQPRDQTFPNLPTAAAGLDRLRKTDSSDSLFHGLGHSGACSSRNPPVIGTFGVLTPPIFGQQCAQAGNSQSNLGHIRYPLELMETKPLSVKREFDKTDESSETDTAKIKRFPCPECGQKFARAFNLQTHISTHVGARPFSCPIDGCSKAFSRRHDLGRHITAIHHQWLAVKNMSVAEAIRLLHWKKAKNSANWHRNRKKNSHQAQ